MTLPETTRIRVWDSTAEVRYLVIPMRPEGTERLERGRLADLVTRDSMIGTGLAAPARAGGVVNGAQDLGGMMGFGPVGIEPDEPWFHAEWERRAFGLTLAMAATGRGTST